MGFQEAVRTVLSKYATFSGRALRSEYWWWTLFMILLGLVTGFVDGLVFGEMKFQPITSIATLALVIPGVAVSVRRLHDVGRSGWWLLILLVPLIGILVILYWTIKKGDETPNQYGAPVAV